ncbi:MAG TPA: alpha/beta hydrolase [Trueperaceae bacterium]
MPFRIKVSLAILLSLLVLALVGPFLIPVPPLEGTSAATSLAGADSNFAAVDGVTLHYLDVGSGPTAFLLLHGYPSNAAGWRSVLPELSLYGRVVAYDRVGFGLSGRPLPGSWERGENPYLPGAQVEQAVALLDELGIDSAVWIASSTGGLVAIRAALEHPDRVSALVLESAPVYSGRSPPAWLRPILYSPQMSRIGPLLMRQLGGQPGMGLYSSQWADPERIVDEDVEDFRVTFRVDDWDEGLWQITRASRPFDVEGELESLGQPVLVIAGAGDQIVPPEESERLAGELSQGTLALMEECGHIVHRECPAQFMQVLEGWLQGL